MRLSLTFGVALGDKKALTERITTSVGGLLDADTSGVSGEVQPVMVVRAVHMRVGIVSN